MVCIFECTQINLSPRYSLRDLHILQGCKRLVLLFLRHHLLHHLLVSFTTLGVVSLILKVMVIIIEEDRQHELHHLIRQNRFPHYHLLLQPSQMVNFQQLIP
jgi:hypothetical protein